MIESPIDNFVRTYLDTLPEGDLTSMIYWDRETLNKVDSEIIRSTYSTTCGYYKSLFKAMIQHPQSPYVTLQQQQ